jgi:hypothetical protein
MIKSKTIRQVLWYGGIVLFVAGVAMFQSQTPVMGWPCLVLAIAAVVLSFHKLTCPSCGKAMREISTGLTNCPYCGAEYNPRETAQQSPET